jgi:hypothetical protein
VFVRGWRYGALDLPICATCDARWRGVLRVRFLAWLALVPVGVVAAVLVDWGAHGARGASWLGMALFIAWASAVAALYLRRWRDRTVSASGIHEQLIVLRGVHPDARQALVREAAAASTIRRIPPGP